MFKLKIETDNAAFEDNPKEEIARLLKGVIDILEARGEDYGKLYDINGNPVGEFKLTQR